MRLAFLDLPPEERRLYIEQAAVRRNVSPVVLEKDFWVCWLLGILFESEFAGSLVFKGGTSRRIGSPAITRIRRRWRSTRPPATPSTNMTSATGSSNGKGSSSAAHGRTMTRRSLELFASFRRPNACPPCGVITRRCGTCFSLSQPVSTTFFRSWPNSKIASTSVDLQLPRRLSAGSSIRLLGATRMLGLAREASAVL
jgi:hypothetical protein